ncbi:hypothetical protein POM88_023439 [Heracleum sosnowskyi]|uniref:Uncharacterized protein n=1 Tax=Heracleum sosnowskyi TaxID=360622 RepID=A0AAD8IH12_9APIA|nr:hypothetical protein POM88_023439 [Heracleum sosnowskyi]
MWLILKTCNEVVFGGASWKTDSLLFCVKKDLVFSGLSHHHVSRRETLLWNYDPGAAIDSFLRAQRSDFITKLSKEFDFVAFCDGAWCIANDNESKGGIGYFILSKDLSKIYMLSGPVSFNDAFESELAACMPVGCNNGAQKSRLQVYYLYGSKNTVEMFDIVVNFCEMQWSRGEERIENRK